MRHSAIALSGPQPDSSIAWGGLCLVEAAPEPDPFFCNSCSPGSLELSQT
jgi:hypothetical protein